jgi:fructokinase
MTLYGVVETGGTKIVCAVLGGPDDVRAEVRFPTTTPEANIPQIIEFLRMHHAQTPLTAIGIGSFGPIVLDPALPNYGSVAPTTKPGWSNAPVVAPITAALQLPVGFDLDVTTAGLGELEWGAGQGLDHIVYYTIGTGIGAGVISRRAPLACMAHPEAGHQSVAPHPDDDFAGNCSFHGKCLEGMAAGPAIEKRWGVKAYDLPVDHPAWELEADYVAQAVVNTILFVSPQRIILGGGVMEQLHLFPMIRQRVLTKLNGYINVDAITQHIDDYVVPPALGNRAGMLGALVLAMRAADAANL